MSDQFSISVEGLKDLAAEFLKLRNDINVVTETVENLNKAFQPLPTHIKAAGLKTLSQFFKDLNSFIVQSPQALTQLNRFLITFNKLVSRVEKLSSPNFTLNVPDNIINKTQELAQNLTAINEQLNKINSTNLRDINIPVVGIPVAGAIPVSTAAPKVSAGSMFKTPVSPQSKIPPALGSVVKKIQTRKGISPIELTSEEFVQLEELFGEDFEKVIKSLNLRREAIRYPKYHPKEHKFAPKSEWANIKRFEATKSLLGGVLSEEEIQALTGQYFSENERERAQFYGRIRDLVHRERVRDVVSSTDPRAIAQVAADRRAAERAAQRARERETARAQAEQSRATAAEEARARREARAREREEAARRREEERAQRAAEQERRRAEEARRRELANWPRHPATGRFLPLSQRDVAERFYQAVRGTGFESFTGRERQELWDLFASNQPGTNVRFRERLREAAEQAYYQGLATSPLPRDRERFRRDEAEARRQAENRRRQAQREAERQAREQERQAREEERRSRETQSFVDMPSPLRRQFSIASLRTLAYGTIGASIWGSVAQFRNLANAIKEVEQSLISLRKVMDPLSTDFNKMSKQLFEIAKATGQEFNKVGAVASELARQGKTQAEVVRIARDAMIMGNIGEIEPQEGVKLLSSVLAQFNLTAEQSTAVIDRLNNVSNKNAVSFQALAEAAVQAGAAFKTTGGSLDELFAITTGVSKATQFGGPRIGRAIRQMFTRLYSPETSRAIEGYGFKTRNEYGGLRAPYEVLGEIADKWKTLGSYQKERLSFAVGGTHYKSFFSALMSNWDTVQKAYLDSLYSQGSAYKENAIYMQSYQAKLQQASAAWTELAQAIGEAGLLDTLKSIAEISKSIAESEITRTVATSIAKPSVARNVIGMGITGSIVAAELLRLSNAPARLAAIMTGERAAGETVQTQSLLLQLLNWLKMRNLQRAGAAPGSVPTEEVETIFSFGALLSQLKQFAKGNKVLLGIILLLTLIYTGVKIWKGHVDKVKDGWGKAREAINSLPFAINNIILSFASISDEVKYSKTAYRTARVGYLRAYKDLVDALKEEAKLQQEVGIGSKVNVNAVALEYLKQLKLNINSFDEMAKLSKEERDLRIKALQKESAMLLLRMEASRQYLAYERTVGKIGEFGYKPPKQGAVSPVFPPGNEYGYRMSPKVLEKRYEQISKEMERNGGISLKYIEEMNTRLDEWYKKRLETTKKEEDRLELELTYDKIQADLEMKRAQLIGEMYNKISAAAYAGVSKEEVYKQFAPQMYDKSGQLTESGKELQNAIEEIYKTAPQLSKIFLEMAKTTDEINEIQKEIRESIANQNALYEYQKSLLSNIVDIYGSMSKAAKDFKLISEMGNIYAVNEQRLKNQEMIAEQRKFIQSAVGAGTLEEPGRNSALENIRREIDRLEALKAGASEKEAERYQAQINTLRERETDIINKVEEAQKNINSLMATDLEYLTKINQGWANIQSTIIQTVEEELHLSGVAEKYKELVKSISGDYHRIISDVAKLNVEQSKLDLKSSLFAGIRQDSELFNNLDDIYLENLKGVLSFHESQYTYYKQMEQDAISTMKELNMLRDAYIRGGGIDLNLSGSKDMNQDMLAYYNTAIQTTEERLRYAREHLTSFTRTLLSSLADLTIAEITVAARKANNEILKIVNNARIEKLFAGYAASFEMAISERAGIVTGAKGGPTRSTLNLEYINNLRQELVKGISEVMKNYYKVQQNIYDAIALNRAAFRGDYEGIDPLIDELRRLVEMGNKIAPNLDSLVKQGVIAQDIVDIETVLNKLADAQQSFASRTGYLGAFAGPIGINPRGSFLTNVRGIVEQETSSLINAQFDAYMELQDKIYRIQERIAHIDEKDVAYKQAQLDIMYQLQDKSMQVLNNIKQTSDAFSGIIIDTELANQRQNMALNYGRMLISGQYGGIGAIQNISSMYKDAFESLAETIFREGSKDMVAALYKYLTTMDIQGAVRGLSKEDADRLRKLDELRQAGRLSFDIDRFTEAVINAPQTLREKMPTALEIMKASGYALNLETEKPMLTLADAIKTYIDPLTSALLDFNNTIVSTFKPNSINANLSSAFLTGIGALTPVPSQPLNINRQQQQDYVENIERLTSSINVHFPSLTAAINNLARSFGYYGANNTTAKPVTTPEQPMKSSMAPQYLNIGQIGQQLMPTPSTGLKIAAPIFALGGG